LRETAAAAAAIVAVAFVAAAGLLHVSLRSRTPR
jgi:hypothetical protein